MAGDIKKVNQQLDKLQESLINQLNSTNIEYVDLLAYYRKVEALKSKKDYLYLSDWQALFYLWLSCVMHDSLFFWLVIGIDLIA